MAYWRGLINTLKFQHGDLVEGAFLRGASLRIYSSNVPGSEDKRLNFLIENVLCNTLHEGFSRVFLRGS